MPFQLREISNQFAGRTKLNGEWKGQSAGGCQNHPLTYKRNPKYQLNISPRDATNLVIELRAQKTYQVGLEVVAVSLEDSTVTAPFRSKVSGSYRSGYCVLDIGDIPAGIYHIIPSTFEPAQEGPFILSVKATTNISVELAN